MKKASIILTTILLLSMSVPAQDKQKFAQAQKANSEALKAYTWKSRTELKLKGESKNVKLEQVRYDIEGKIQKTPVGGTPSASGGESSGRGVRGRLKQKVVENKKEEFAELMRNLASLVLSYVHMTPEQTQSFTQNATTTLDPSKTLIIKGANVLQQGDSMTVWVNAQTMMMQRVEILTSLENKPVHFKAEFQPASNGPTHMTRATLQYPEKGIELTIDNYEYVRAG